MKIFSSLKKITVVVTLLSGLYLVSCNTKTTTPKPKTVCDSIEMSVSEHLVDATLWFQRSAEKRALYYQCYSYAKLALDKQLASQNGKNKYAVIVDIDETVLDNSPYQGMLIRKGLSFSSQTWKEWTALATAKALPGAVEFTNYAESKGIDVFYVSNRDEDEKQATIRNLNSESFPFADEQHVLCRVNKESNKKPRYDAISETHQILLIVGDNLRDFDELFGNRIKNYGFNAVDSLKDQFGEKFIMLPNPMYGDWEKAIYGGKYPGEIERNKLKKQALESI